MSTLKRWLSLEPLFLLLLCGCQKRVTQAALVTGGDADRGRLALERYGCGSCHRIPGVRGARGLTGPPLQGLEDRIFIAGVVRNEPASLVRWIMDPPAIDPLTAMPALGVSEADARDIAEYLYQRSRR
jgi:cytochrome c1